MDAAQKEMLGREIRAARQARGWSTRDLERESGVSTTTITKVENGRGDVRPGKLRQVRDALGLEPLAQVADRDGYPADVVFVRNFVGQWLMGAATPEQRQARAEAIARLIATGIPGGNGPKGP